MITRAGNACPLREKIKTTQKLLRKKKKKKKKLLQTDFYSKPETKGTKKRREFIWLFAHCHLGYSEGSQILF